MRHRTPGNTASNDIENAVENLTFGIGFRSTARFCLRKQWLQNLPLFIIEVSGIGFSGFHTASLSQQTIPIPDFFDTLLGTTWTLTGNNGSDEEFKGIPADSLVGKQSVKPRLICMGRVFAAEMMRLQSFSFRMVTGGLRI